MTNPVTVNQNCAICLASAPSNPLEAVCKHIFCRDCFIQSQASQADDSCALCGRATQISLHSLLDADIDTMDMQQTDLQTRIDALYAQSHARALMMNDHLAVRSEDSLLEQTAKANKKIVVTLHSLTAHLQLMALDTQNRQVGSCIEALRRASQALSTGQSTRPMIADMIINQGQPILILQKRIQDTTIAAQALFGGLAETTQNIDTSPKDAELAKKQ